MENLAKSNGGIARAKILTHEEMSEIGRKGAIARWNGNILKATHGSEDNPLKIGDIEIPCYVLENGTRVLSQRGLYKALGISPGGANKGRAKIVSILERIGSKGLNINEIRSSTENPIRFQDFSGKSYLGYPAVILPKICSIILEAADVGEILTSRQLEIARRCEILIRGFATVGIIALIDETVGYIADKRKEEYRNIFRDFIREEQRKWEKEFPDQFFDMLYKIYSLKRTRGNPSFFGHVIRKYIYHPLANSNGAILEELESKNPVVYVGGGRKYRLFQFLSERIGLPALRNHLWQVIGIGNSVDTKEEFENAFKKAFPVITIDNLVKNEIQKMD